MQKSGKLEWKGEGILGADGLEPSLGDRRELYRAGGPDCERSRERPTGALA